MNERPIPEAAQRDENSVEMMRAWIAEKGLHCSIKVGMYKDSGLALEERAWGILLADVARHVSMALDQFYDANAATSLDAIRASFLAELSKPTSNVHGKAVP